MNHLKLLLLSLLISIFPILALGNSMSPISDYISFSEDGSGFKIADGQSAASIYVDTNDWTGVKRAARSLCSDIEKVSGQLPQLSDTKPATGSIIIGTIGKSKYIDDLVKNNKIDVSGIDGRWESFLIETVDGNLVIAGSDKRGTIYGVYDLAEKIGVSPWYYWADVPVQKHDNLYVKEGRYVMPSPKVKYRGIFLNDEAPCLTSWVGNTFGTNYGGHEFYEKVFELILRLKGNYLWPAMWVWAFYADDPANSQLADEMGVVIGTSHHEPMARNHQEWARHRNDYGAWDYATNQKVIDKFFTEGAERVADKDDIITIGMRGDGDAPMGGKEGHDHEYKSQDRANLELLQKIIKNQRKIIGKATGKSPEKHPQLWALYKEVQKYYDMGLQVPDDVIILLCDDNWGNVRRLPNDKERKHPGGWGMYYHVDYVGAPRNTKWLNVTPIQNMWEQLSLTYEYGVDALWILNVGDLKPMEYPITLFLDMAWDPEKFTADNLMEHPTDFCRWLCGEENAAEAADILNLYCKYNGRVTPEMLDANTYDVTTGEWKQVRDDYMALETRALRLFNEIDDDQRAAYQQLILYPVQAMANLYDMYYSQAMNRKLYELGDPACNIWADKVEKAFARDAKLAHDYNHVMANGKWNGMMTQKHIGYNSWNDNFPADTLPEIHRINADNKGGFEFKGANGVVAIEAEHYHNAKDAAQAKWTVIPDMGRTLSGVTLMPRRESTDGASLAYKMQIDEMPDSVDVYVILKSTLPFERGEGHRFDIAFGDNDAVMVNYNADLNDQVGNPYEKFYPTVARRVIEQRVRLPLDKKTGKEQTLTIRPLDPGAVFEKVVVDYGGYRPTYLYMNESEYYLN